MEFSTENKIDFFVMLESMTESVLITSADLDLPGPTIIYVNLAFEKMTGWTRKEILGKNPRFLQGPKTDYHIFQDMREKLENGKIWRGRTLNYKKDGSEFYMQWSIVSIRNAQGANIQYLAVQTDVTYLTQTERKLLLSRKLEQKRLVEIEKTNKKLTELIAQQKKTLDLFAKYVPASIVKKTLAKKKSDIKKGKKLEAGLLFCDIRGFTTIAEKLNPSQTVHVLNTYYSMMSEVIKQHNGVINQFVGDEIFVTFGAPLSISDPEISAVRCALGMIQKLTDINNILQDSIHSEIVVGIGINFGPIIAGNLGSEDRLSYSVTGDAVNTAKRIESLSREFPNSILISQPIFEKTQSIVQTEPLGAVPIKGKNEKVNVFKVVS